MPSTLRARLAIVGAALLFSTGGAAIKMVDLEPLQLAGVRAGLAVLTLLVVLRVPLSSFRPAALMIGVAQAATLILFVIGNKLTTAASTIFLQSTAPLYVLLLSPALLGERIRRSDVGFLGLFALGLVPFFLGTDPTQATAPDPWRGNLAGLAGGATWAATVLGLRWLALRQHAPVAHEAEAGVARVDAERAVGDRDDAELAGRDLGGGARAARDPNLPAAATIIGNTLVFLICLPSLTSLPVITAQDALVLGWLGAFQVGMAYALLARGVREVRAFDATMLMLIEPVLNPVWAWLLHAETPGGWTLAGGAIILATTAVRTWTSPRS